MKWLHVFENQIYYFDPLLRILKNLGIPPPVPRCTMFREMHNERWWLSNNSRVEAIELMVVGSRDQGCSISRDAINNQFFGTDIM